MAETVRTAVARSEDVIDRLLVLAESEQLSDTHVVALRRAHRRRDRPPHARRAGAGAVACRRPARRRRCTATAPCSSVSSTTSSTTRCATRAADSVVTVAVGPPARAGSATLRVANAGEAIDPTSCPICSSASTGAARRAAGTTAARAWAWRSSRRWPRLTAGRPRPKAPASGGLDGHRHPAGVAAAALRSTP